MTLYAFHEPRKIVMVFFVIPAQIGHLVAVLLGVYLLSAMVSYTRTGEFLDAPSVIAAAGFAAAFALGLAAAAAGRLAHPGLQRAAGGRGHGLGGLVQLPA